MSNPISLFDELREMYLRYLDSPFDLRYPDLINERRNLLSADGHIFRPPLIEPVPAYQSSNQSFQAIAQAHLGGVWSQAEINDVANFVSLELFPPSRLPYTHQEEVFTQSVVNGRDVVVTTGTGSGKTEYFLLPVIAALVRESAAWGPSGTARCQVGLVEPPLESDIEQVASANTPTQPRECRSAASGHACTYSLSPQCAG
jgi:DEAD/DEAH box helicase domain-containing protein